MFSRVEKNRIAAAVESVLREINHPEMGLPEHPVVFSLHVYGAEPWSWADIEPNRSDLLTGKDQNLWNERVRE